MTTNSSIDIGSTSLTTLGTISTGTWQGTSLGVGYGGTGNTTFTAYSVLCAGTTSTGAFQNVSGVGTSGQVLTSNGASALPTWQAAGAGGSGALVLISTATASNSASIAFTGLTSTYQAYVVLISNMVPVTNNTNLNVVVGTGATPTYQTTSYYAAVLGFNVARTKCYSSSQSNVSQWSMNAITTDTIVNTSNSAVNATFTIFNPSQSTTNQYATWLMSYKGSQATTVVIAEGSSVWQSTTAVTAIKFSMSSGNISAGTFTLYGMTS